MPHSEQENIPYQNNKESNGNKKNATIVETSRIK